MDYKQCSKCRILKPVGEFHRDKAKYLGLTAYCKSCHKEYTRLWSRAHPEKIRNYRAAFILKNPERYRSKRNDYQRKYVLKDPERQRAKNRAYYHANREEIEGDIASEEAQADRLERQLYARQGHA